MSLTLAERLIAMRTGGTVERCHGVLHYGSYSVAAHSWGVAVLMLLLWPDDFPRLAIHCVVHDIPEAWVGDIPATTKKFGKGIKAECDRLESAIFNRLMLPNDSHLEPEDREKLKACDKLELYLWAREQCEAGNMHADCVVCQLDDFFKEDPLPARAHQLYSEVRRMSVQHRTDGLIKELCRS